MKNLLLTLLLGLSNLSHSQEKIAGKYCVDYEIKDISKCLILKENKRFSILTEEHLSSNTKLSGTWAYKNTNLILKYDESKFIKSTNVSISKSPTEKDSITVLFRVKDFQKGPMLGLQINFNNYPTLITDIRGEARVKFKKSKKIINSFTSYLGYEKCHVSFDLCQNKIIDININRKQNESKYRLNILKGFNYKKETFITVSETGKKIKWKKYGKP